MTQQQVWTIRGRGGRLRSGARIVATLGKWSAIKDQSGQDRWNLSVAEVERDPIGWENHNPETLIAELRLIGGDWRGRARIVSADPLVADIWRDDAGD